MKILIDTCAVCDTFNDAYESNDAFAEIYERINNDRKFRTSNEAIDLVLSNRELFKKCNVEIIDIPDEVTDWDIFTWTFSYDYELLADEEYVVYVLNGKMYRAKKGD